MSETISFDSPAQDIGYFIFMDRDEETVLYTKGVLDDTINGYLVLTTKKLFFFFWSNINRDKKFIASYPYIVSVEIQKHTKHVNFFPLFPKCTHFLYTTGICM